MITFNNGVKKYQLYIHTNSFEKLVVKPRRLLFAKPEKYMIIRAFRSMYNTRLFEKEWNVNVNSL